MEGASDGDWEVSAELLPGPPGTDADPCYPSDLRPLDRAAHERFVRHALSAQRDLAAAAALPDAILDWVPKGLVAEHADPWAPEPRTIRQIARHVLQLDVFYREGLRDGPAAGIFEKVSSMADEQARTLAEIQESGAVEPDRVFHPRHLNSRRPEGGPEADWTVRKVLRRLITHNRQQAFEIAQRRSWIVLGVPGQRS